MKTRPAFFLMTTILKNAPAIVVLLVAFCWYQDLLEIDAQE